MSFEQNKSTESNKNALKEGTDDAISSIKNLESKGSNLYAKLEKALGDFVPKMPEKLGKIELAQKAIAKELGMEKEFIDDEDPEKRIQNALTSMSKLSGEPLRTIDPSKLHASDVDLADAKSNPESLV